MIERGGAVAIRMLENVQQRMIKPLIQATIASGTLVYTDEYDIYSRLEEWGYDHESICHSADGPRSRDRPLYLLVTSAIGGRFHIKPFEINVLIFFNILSYMIINH